MRTNVDFGATAHSALSRRDALGLIAGSLAAGTLSGCCPTRYLGTASTSSLPLMSGTPFLAPGMTRNTAPGAKSYGLKYCVDAHAHFFNASDVAVKDYLGKCIAHRLEPEAIQKLVAALSPIANLLAAIAPTAAEEMRDLKTLDLAVSVAANSAEASEALVERAYLEELNRVSYRLADLWRKNSDFAKAYRNAASEAQQAALSPATLSEADIRRIATRDVLPRPADVQQGAVESMSLLDRADGIVAFVVFMCSARWTNVRRYRQAYTDGSNAFGITHVLGALVDFDYWLDCPPLSSHQDQIELQARLSDLSGGYMRPLVAYNPKTDVVIPGAALDRVRRAMELPQYVGIKIYPPNGFLPAGNSDAGIEHALHDFFKLCADNDYPVMAHSSKSMGRNAVEDEYGGPNGWATLLKSYANETKTPIINVAHFGGGPPAHGQSNTWTNDFAALMSYPGASRLFADIGFWDELKACVDSRSCAARVRLRDALALNNHLADNRILYGTDWFMTARVKHWPEYPYWVANALQDVLPLEKLFGTNARACFPKLQH